MATDTLYYDAQCPLCSKEIAFIRKYSQSSLACVDAHSLNNEESINKDDLLKILHLQTADGKWLLGLDATVRAWSHTPYGMLLKPLRIWPISAVADQVYQYWANKRFNRRYVCSQCKT